MITGTEADCQSDAGSTKDGWVMGVVCECMSENWPRYHDIALYNNKFSVFASSFWRIANRTQTRHMVIFGFNQGLLPMLTPIDPRHKLSDIQILRSKIIYRSIFYKVIWWRHDQGALSALLAFVRESDGGRWIKGHVLRSFDIFFVCWTGYWINSRVSGDLRHHNDHVTWQ